MSPVALSGRLCGNGSPEGFQQGRIEFWHLEAGRKKTSHG